MSFEEIVFRGWRFFQQIIEKKRVTAGWSPKPKQEVKCKKSLLPNFSSYEDLWKNKHSLHLDKLDELLDGKIDLFGHQSITLGDTLDWSMDPISGKRTPNAYGKSINYRDNEQVGNIKVIWEIGRHHHLVPLTIAYVMTGNKNYRDAVVKQIDTWVNQNPFAIGIHWSSSLELALRLISWSIIHSLLLSKDGGNGLLDASDDSSKLIASIYQQAWFIRHFLSRYSSAGNHLFGELCGLWVTCQVFDFGKEGANWSEHSHGELEKELKKQVFSDGVGKEQAIYYHLWILDYALFLYTAGQRVKRPFSQDFKKRIELMAEFVREVTPKNGTPPQIGDADDGFVTRFSANWPTDPFSDVLESEQCVIQGRSLNDCFLEKAFWYGVISRKTNSNVNMDTKVSLEEKHKYPKIYDKGGYAVLCDKDCHLVFDAGSLGYLSIAAHGHADALNFTLAIDGEWWLVDPGTYVYHQKEDWRNYFRGTSAHNCIVINETNQSEICGPFMWSKHAHASLLDWGRSEKDIQWVEGSHNGYESMGVSHKRVIQLIPEEGVVKVLDSLGGAGEHLVEFWLHCAPDIKAKIFDNGKKVVLTKESGEKRVIVQLDNNLQCETLCGQESPYITGWYSSKLDHRQPAVAIRAHSMLKLPLEMSCLIHYQCDNADTY